MSRITELPAPWIACGALRMGNTACAQAVGLARLLGLMHVCLHAYVVAYVFFYPFAVEKVSLAAASRCATWTCSCVLFCLVSSWVSPVEWMQSREGDLGLGGACAFVACLHVYIACFSVSALCLWQLYFLLHRAVVCTRPTLCLPTARGKYCPRSSCCACQAFRPYACMFACICCCLCLLLPIRSRKSVPCCRFALCNMNLFMCFVLPSLLLSKSRSSSDGIPHAPYFYS